MYFSFRGASPNGVDAEIIEVNLNPAVLTEVQCTKIDSKCKIILYRYKHASKMELGRR